MSFADDVEQIRRSIATGSGGSAAQLRRVHDGLRSIALVGFSSIQDDIEDIVAETFLRFVAAVLGGHVDPARPAHLYLIQTARDVAAERPRREQPLGLDVPASRSDDAVSSLLQDAASSEAIDAAMAAARRNGDHGAAKVAAVWLVLAQDLGRAPSSSQAAEAAGISSTDVTDALTRFGRYIREAAPERTW